MASWRLSVVLTLLISLVTAGAQERLGPAIHSYERAAFEEALAALEALPATELDIEQRLAADHYRVLCLLALDRGSDAASVMQSLIELHPAYELDDETSPRVRRMFDDVRRRIVPDLMRRRYVEAKAHYDARRLDAALAGFAVVRNLGAAMDATLNDPALHDLVQLVDGFHTLATAARTAGATTSTVAPVAALAPPPAPVASATTAVVPTPAPAAGLAAGVFGPGDADVTPAVPLAQGVDWRRGVPKPHAGAPLGTIEVVVDESGVVVGTRILGSVSAFYDAILIESARAWRYRPAVRAEKPVKYRRVVEMIAGR